MKREGESFTVVAQDKEMFDLRYQLDEVVTGKTYYFQITATNEVGESLRSETLSVIAGTVPG